MISPKVEKDWRHVEQLPQKAGLRLPLLRLDHGEGEEVAGDEEEDHVDGDPAGAGHGRGLAHPAHPGHRGVPGVLVQPPPRGELVVGASDQTNVAQAVVQGVSDTRPGGLCHLLLLFTVLLRFLCSLSIMNLECKADKFEGEYEDDGVSVGRRLGEAESGGQAEYCEVGETPGEGGDVAPGGGQEGDNQDVAQDLDQKVTRVEARHEVTYQQSRQSRNPSAKYLSSV